MASPADGRVNPLRSQHGCRDQRISRRSVFGWCGSAGFIVAVVSRGGVGLWFAAAVVGEVVADTLASVMAGVIGDVAAGVIADVAAVDRLASGGLYRFNSVAALWFWFFGWA